jgi:hypothetical protein
MKTCNVDGCGKLVVAKGYCKTHWARYHRRGVVSKRTRLDKNEIILCSEYAEIVVYNTYGIEKARTKIDLDDVVLASKHKWHINNHGYVATMSEGKRTFLHNVLLGRIIGHEIDHIDGNQLNNRRSNLRRCTHGQNMFNQRHNSKNKSGFLGVAFYSYRNAWTARIKCKGKTYNLGSYKTREEAALARIEAEERFFEGFAPLRTI